MARAGETGEFTITYGSALLLALMLVASMEWHTDEDVVTLATLLVASFSLGWIRPCLFLLSGLLVGFVVPLLNLLVLITKLRPAYASADATAQHGSAYYMSLVILIVPAVLASLAGKLVRNRHASQL